MLDTQTIEIDQDTGMPIEVHAKRGRKSKEEELESMVQEIAARASSAAINAVIGQTTERLKQIEDQAKLAITPRHVCLHVKINETPIAKLSYEAHELLPKLITLAKLGENILLVGPAGCGKTTLAHQLAEALTYNFAHLCCSAGMSESYLAGRYLPTGEFKEAEFSRMYREGGVFLLDELDAADANVLLLINTALANGEFYNPISGKTSKRHEKFVCVAGANTFGLGGTATYTGRNRLDAATLDRFVPFKIEYNKELEKKLCPEEKILEAFHRAREKLNERGAQQVISTRLIARAYKMHVAGFDAEDIISTVTVAWPKGLADEIDFKSKKNAAKKEGKPAKPTADEPFPF
jgi:cobaltochelatase CobS